MILNHGCAAFLRSSLKLQREKQSPGAEPKPRPGQIFSERKTCTSDIQKAQWDRADGRRGYRRLIQQNSREQRPAALADRAREGLRQVGLIAVPAATRGCDPSALCVTRALSDQGLSAPIHKNEMRRGHLSRKRLPTRPLASCGYGHNPPSCSRMTGIRVKQHEPSDANGLLCRYPGCGFLPPHRGVFPRGSGLAHRKRAPGLSGAAKQAPVWLLSAKGTRHVPATTVRWEEAGRGG